jgi:SsrA-binding protein
MEVKNKKAYFDYFVEEEFIAGIVLIGGEIKSVRQSKLSISEAYCYITNDNEIFLKGSYIKLYENSGIVKYDEHRLRKLLLKKSEILKISRFMKEHKTGYTLIPLSIFINSKGLCKVKIGICKGKKNYDKRETIKERENKRQMKKEI